MVKTMTTSKYSCPTETLLVRTTTAPVEILVQAYRMVLDIS